MKKIIFLLFLIPKGCSADSDANEKNSIIIEDPPILIEEKPKSIENRDALTKPTVTENCSTEPLLDMYEDFVELGIKEANLSTENTNITFKKRSLPDQDVRDKLKSEFGENFLTDACKLGGLTFFVEEAYSGGQGAFVITYNTTESAIRASNILKNLKRNNFKTNKFLTLYDWRVNNNSILVNFFDQAIVRFYESKSM